LASAIAREDTLVAVSVRVVVASVAVAAVVLAGALVLDVSLARAALLAPVLVVGVAAVAGLLLLWVRVGLEQLRESRRPGLIVAIAVAGIGLLVVLTILGVKLPRE
jgi:hypothetical protein